MSRKTFIRIAAIVVGILVVALATLEIAARIIIGMTHFNHYGTAEMDLKYELAVNPPTDAPTIFFMGSSHTARAVFADLVERRLRDARLDVNVRNLGSPDSYTGDQLFLLKTAVDHGAKPAAVVYEVLPLLIDTTASPYAPIFSRSPEGQLIAPMNRPSMLKRFLLNNSYLVRYRVPLYKLCRKIPRMIFAPAIDYRVKEPFGEHSECTPGGWLLALKEKALYEAQKPTVVDRYYQLRSILTDKAELDGKPTYEILDTIRDYCSLNKIPLLLVDYPIDERLRAYTEEQLHTSRQELRRRMQSLATQWKCELIDLEDNFNQSYFADCDHVNVLGAIDLSERLAAGLLQRKNIWNTK